MKHIMIVAAALALFAVPGRASAQDPWLALVQEQLQAASSAVQSEGFASTHDVVTGRLAEGEAEEIEVELDAGIDYVVLGVCDQDCSDVDLVLRDPAGNVVDNDVATDDVPVVAVSPTRTGTYTVEVHMAACSAEPCRYGVAVYGN